MYIEEDGMGWGMMRVRGRVWAADGMDSQDSISQFAYSRTFNFIRSSYYNVCVCVINSLLL